MIRTTAITILALTMLVLCGMRMLDPWCSFHAAISGRNNTGQLSFYCGGGHINFALATRTDEKIECELQAIRLPGGFMYQDQLSDYYAGEDPYLERVRILNFPVWFLVLGFGTYPTLAFIRGPLKRWRRRRKGLCLKCGYDLQGNVTGVCSECGAEIESR